MSCCLLSHVKFANGVNYEKHVSLFRNVCLISEINKTIIYQLIISQKYYCKNEKKYI